MDTEYLFANGQNDDDAYRGRGRGEETGVKGVFGPAKSSRAWTSGL